MTPLAECATPTMQFSTFTLERMKVAAQGSISSAVIESANVETWYTAMADSLCVRLTAEVLAERVLDTEVEIPWQDETVVLVERCRAARLFRPLADRAPRWIPRRLFKWCYARHLPITVGGRVKVPATYWRKFPEADVPIPRLGRAVTFPILGVPSFVADA